MIQWMIVKFIVRQAVGKFLRDVTAHVKAGGWNRKVPKVVPKHNYRGRFEPPNQGQPQPPAKVRDRHGDKRMTGDQIAGFVRHILTFAGGWVVSQGYVDESTAMEAAGALATIAGLVWSYVVKMQNVEDNS